MSAQTPAVPVLADPDGFYEKLIRLHDGLDAEQSMLLNARLILLMAQQIGDDRVLGLLLAAAAGKPHAG
jgi:hypothetical protein